MQCSRVQRHKPPDTKIYQYVHSKAWQQKTEYREAPRYTTLTVLQHGPREAWQQKTKHREASPYKPPRQTVQTKASQHPSNKDLNMRTHGIPSNIPRLVEHYSIKQPLPDQRSFSNDQELRQSEKASSHGIFHVIHQQERGQRLSLTWREPPSLPKPICKKKVNKFIVDYPTYMSSLKKEISNIDTSKVMIYRGKNSDIQQLKRCFQNLDLQIPLRVTNDYSEVDPKLILYLSGLRGEIKDILETVL